MVTLINTWIGWWWPCLTKLPDKLQSWGEMLHSDTLSDCTHLSYSAMLIWVRSLARCLLLADGKDYGIRQGLSTGGPRAKSSLPTIVVWPFDHLWNTYKYTKKHRKWCLFSLGAFIFELPLAHLEIKLRMLVKERPLLFIKQCHVPYKILDVINASSMATFFPWL